MRSGVGAGGFSGGEIVIWLCLESLKTAASDL